MDTGCMTRDESTMSSWDDQYEGCGELVVILWLALGDL